MNDTLTAQQVFRKNAAGEPVHFDDQEQVHTHVISVRLANHLGALNRVASLFSARGFNLDSVSVGVTEHPEVSRLTLVTSGNDRIIAQVVRQLDNLVDTLEVADLTTLEYVERELCLLKTRYNSETRSEIMDIIEIFRGQVVNITAETMTVEVTGPSRKINAFMGVLEPMGIIEVARSGSVAMLRPLSFEHANDKSKSQK